MRITQKDLAEQLNVSLITVSRALNGTGYVSRELKERIIAHARSMNYTPHKASQVLVRNRVRKIGFFSSTYPSYFWNDVRKGAAVAGEQLEGFNYQVGYHAIPDGDTDRYVRTLEREVEQGLSGVALVNQRQYDMDRIFRVIEGAGLPYVTFNVDAPRSGRLCYIGTDYRAGGRLAGEFIGKMLTLREKARVLVINLNESLPDRPGAPDINSARQAGFLQVMGERYPRIACEVAMVTTHYDAVDRDTQISDLLREKRGKVDGVYLIPAFNNIFLSSLERFDYRKTVTLLHELDQSALRYLETDLLSGVIYQNPVFQGYYAARMLEHILETSREERLRDRVIAHNMILAENRDLISNHFVYADPAE